MLERTFASKWLRVCVGALAALAVVLATTAPASASERGPASHLVARRGPAGGPHVFHGGGGGYHGGPRYRRHYRTPRHPNFRRY